MRYCGPQAGCRVCIRTALKRRGALQLCKSLFAELDRHLHEVLGPRLDELGMLRYGQEWPQPPQHFAR